MCGRFTQAMTWRQLVDLYRIHEQAELPLEPRYNVAPTQQVLAIRQTAPDEREAFLPRWGLVPSWAKELSIGNRMINARAEGVADKPSFRAAFKARRCLIPASGFYEWSGPRAARQPHYIQAHDGRPLTFAGLWESWRDRTEPDAPPLETCTIITTAASPDVADLHERMPVVLADEAWDTWLDPQAPLPLLQDLLQPAPAGTLTYHPVDRQVGSPKAQGAELIVPLAQSS
ncbi:SOS response-associated peptidase [Aquibaculum sediminis]|uniref:SOS response-associated peptidase n=1 Tax=Aquibaculum sediminis TaxID=3231907 RepID=UPI0034562A09